MSTLRDLLNASARSINIVRQNAVLTGENLTVAMYALERFVETCSNNKLLVYSVTEYEFPLTGAEKYTLGLGGDWDVGRPMKIETAYARLNPGSQQQLDIAMQPLTYMQYAGIAVKNTPSTFPFAYYDDNSYPLRTITLFPVPTGPANIVLWLREPLLDMSVQSVSDYKILTGGTGYTDGFYPNVTLGGGSGTGAQANITCIGGDVFECVLVNAGTGYTVGDVLTVSNAQVGGTGSGFTAEVLFVSGNLDTPIDFPPGYERFFRYNLAVELAPEFGKTPSDLVLANARQSKLEIESLNSTPVYTRGDGGMSRSGRNRFFNWITGNFWSFGNN